MPYCSKCGAETKEEMAFCPKCGATLKVEPTRAEPVRRRERREKEEKAEKQEKSEKEEKYEKREFGLIGPLIGGVILIILGLTAYLHFIGYRVWEYVGAFFVIVLGLLIIFGVLYARIRHPKP